MIQITYPRGCHIPRCVHGWKMFTHDNIKEKNQQETLYII